MLEKLSELVRAHAQDAIVNNNEIPNEKNEEVIQAASGSIFETLKNQISSGNMGALTDIFNGGNTNDSVVSQQASGSFIDKLNGLGINANVARGIAGSLIPMIVGKLTQKIADPNDSSFNIKDILGSLSGGSDGKLDMNDVLGMFKGGMGHANGQSNTESASGGGMLDQIKGMFK